MYANGDKADDAIKELTFGERGDICRAMKADSFIEQDFQCLDILLGERDDLIKQYAALVKYDLGDIKK